jgi:hypothetical protein
MDEKYALTPDEKKFGRYFILERYIENKEEKDLLEKLVDKIQHISKAV